MTQTEMLVGLLADLLMILGLTIATVEWANAFFTSFFQLVHKCISLIGTLNEDDALIDLASLQDLVGKKSC